MSEEKPKAAFVTFYSFKGGVGRSMALINTAGILAGRGFRVLVIDLDLEAPGFLISTRTRPMFRQQSSNRGSVRYSLGSWIC